MVHEKGAHGAASEALRDGVAGARGDDRQLLPLPLPLLWAAASAAQAAAWRALLAPLLAATCSAEEPA